MGQKLQREDSAVAHRPWRWTRRLTIASAALAAAVIVALVVVLRLRRTDCAAASRFETDSTVVVVGQREYESSREPSTGAELADAYRRSGNLDAAVALANELLVTDARANALGILGKVAYAQHRPEDGVRFLQEARELHRRQGSHLGLARDDQYLGMIQSRLTHYTEALQTLEEGIVEASTAGDASVEGVCHLTAARVLIDIGYFEAAHEEMDRAGRQLSTERDLAQLWFMKGNLEQEADRGLVPFAHQRSAVAMFERSLEIARRRQITSLILSLDLNLASSLAEIGRTDDAERHLAEAAVLDRDRTFESTRAQLAARIAYRRGNHELAYTLNERQFPSIKDEDEQIDVCVMQARIALASGDPTAAATWATRGVDVAEKMRADQQGAELRPWVRSEE